LFGLESTFKNKSPFAGIDGHVVPNVADPFCENGLKSSTWGFN
jgi:hypothetical protein